MARTAPNKYDKIPGVGAFAEWVPKNKIRHFKKLFDEIKEVAGSENKAADAAGVTRSRIYAFTKEGKLSAYNGRKILEAHRKIFNDKGHGK